MDKLERLEIIKRIKELELEVEYHIKLHHEGENAGVLKLVK